MKKIILLLTFLSLYNLTNSQDKGSVYEWPIKPGSHEWKALKTHDEMVEVLQIPIGTLKNMSTDDLVETCLSYPLYLDILAFNSVQEGIDKMFANFNGFQELMIRSDVGKKLLKKYQKINLSDIKNEKTNIWKGQFKINICKLELLLSQDAILQKMSNIDRMILVKEVLNKNRIILDSGEYSFYSYESNAFLCIRVLFVEDSEILKKELGKNMNLKHFLRRGTGANKQIINDIVEIANVHLTKSN